VKHNRQTIQLPAASSGTTGWLAPDQFEHFRDLLAEFSGVYLDATRQRQLESGLGQRLRAIGDTLVGYQRRLRAPAGRDELRRLAELVLNHETVFFRNGAHFNALRHVLLNELHDRKPIGAPIRIWSAGCATGEEAYSLAIIALETLGQPLARPIEIWGTDLSVPALQKARTGFYRGRAFQNTSPDLLMRYFHAKDDGYTVNQNVRALVRFEQLNLLDVFPTYAQGIDIIFCQNVTIYFQLKTCRQLIGRFYDCLPDGGLLFLGFSETLWNVFDHFHTRDVASAYVYYKEALAWSPPFVREHRTDTRRPIQSVRQPSEPAVGKPTRPHRSNSKDQSRKLGTLVHEPVQLAQSQQLDQPMLDKGQTLLEQGRFEEALETLRHIAPSSANAPRALTLIARAHADRGDLDLAIAEVQRAIEIDALDHDAYLLLGIIYHRQGQLAAAIQQLERARYLSADSAVISFHLAEAYRQAGRIDRAAQEYRNTLQKLEKHPLGALLDGVAVGWLRETCRRQIEYLPRTM
jgi:chemotaxis protein methyltransferase CheR